MSERLELLKGTPDPEEEVAEAGLRPIRLDEFIGQGELKEHLHIILGAARARSQPTDHLLFAGPPGLGKTTLAHIVAKEMEAGLHITSGPALERAGDLAAILTKLEDGDVLFIDEIHRLPRMVEEVMYPAMEDFNIDIVLGKGPAARSIRLELSRFTLVGATTRTGLITGPLRDRFGLVSRLDYYTTADLEAIVARAAAILDIQIDPAGAAEIACRARGTPRIANRLAAPGARLRRGQSRWGHRPGGGRRRAEVVRRRPGRIGQDRPGHSVGPVRAVRRRARRPVHPGYQRE